MLEFWNYLLVLPKEEFEGLLLVAGCSFIVGWMLLK